MSCTWETEQVVRTVSVCVCTFRRPEGLRRLLLALVDQQLPEGWRMAIHIADNDHLGSGRPVVEDMRFRGVPAHYDVEPEQSISRARNRSVKSAEGEYIAITDDDLAPDPHWLAQLLVAAEVHGADMVHGPVVPHFVAGTPRFVRQHPVFWRTNPETGAVRGYTRATANCLFRRSLIEGIEEPFDPRLGHTGGEDVAFFNGLAQRGARGVWCREAIVHSSVAPHRSTFRWLFQRRFRYGCQHRRLVGPIGFPILGRAVGGHFRDVLRRQQSEGVEHAAEPLHERMVRVAANVALDAAFALGVLADLLGISYREYGGPRFVLRLRR